MTRFAIINAETRECVAKVTAPTYRAALDAWVAKNCGTGPVAFVGRVTRKTCVVRSCFDVEMFGGPGIVRAVRISDLTYDPPIVAALATRAARDGGAS